MTKRRDDTTEPEGEPRRERESEPRSYYYDDDTGYEVYDPEATEEEGTHEDDETGDV